MKSHGEFAMDLHFVVADRGGRVLEKQKDLFLAPALRSQLAVVFHKIFLV